MFVEPAARVTDGLVGVTDRTGAVPVLMVKYSIGAVELEPAELEADTVHRYAVPFARVPEGMGAVLVVTFAP
jgi:hypothetical protein